MLTSFHAWYRCNTWHCFKLSCTLCAWICTSLCRYQMPPQAEYQLVILIQALRQQSPKNDRAWVFSQFLGLKGPFLPQQALEVCAGKSRFIFAQAAVGAKSFRVMRAAIKLVFCTLPRAQV